MAWKTGRSRTLTATANITGSIFANVNYEQVSSYTDAYWHVSAFGMFAEGKTYKVPYPPGSPDDNIYTHYWSVIAGNEVQSDKEEAVIWTPPPANPPNYVDQYSYHYSVNVGGMVTFSVPVEEWMDVSVIARSQADQDAGIIDAPARLAFVVYEAIVPGSSATVTASSGGVTAAASIPASAAGFGGYGCGLNVVVKTFGSAAVDVATTLTAAGVSVIGDKSVSKCGCTADTLGGAHAAAASVGNNDQASASVALGFSPPKAFNLSGTVYAVDQPYTGSVTLNCSKYRGDPAPALTAAPTFSASHSQRRMGSSVAVQVNYGDGSVCSGNDSDTIDEWQPLGVTVDDGWCLANGEYVTGGGGGNNVYDDAVTMHGWTFGGVALSQAANLVLDPCTSATGWTGAAVGGGGLQNTAASMVRTFSPAKNLAGYRYLRLNMQASSGSHPFTVNIGGKTWTRSAAATPMDFDLDLCNPDNATAASDITDTRWPVADPALSYGDDAPAVDGPLWGVGYTGGLTISGLDSGVTYTLTGLSQWRHTQVTAHFLPTHAPRFDGDMVQESPSAVNNSGTTTDVHCRRFLMADTDGRQSLEYRDISVSKVVGGESGVTYYIPDYVPIADLGFSGGAASANAGYPGGQYPGWIGSIHAPVADGSQNVHGGYLNSSSPATWLMGGGLLYSGGAWQSGVGMDATNGLTVPAQMLFDSIEWYPGAGDVFGFTDGKQGEPLVLAAHKIFRAQAHGALMTTTGQPAPGQQVTLTPAGSALQSDTAPAGWGQSGRPEGQYHTSGPGVIGYTVGSPSGGTVSAVGTSATTSLQTRHLSRVALRGTAPPADCCDQLLFQTPMLHDPLPELPGDADALPVDEWRR